MYTTNIVYINELTILVQLIFILLFFLCLINTILLMSSNYFNNIKYKWYNFSGNWKFFLIACLCLINLINLYLIYRLHFINILSSYIDNVITINFLFSNICVNIDELALVFIILISFLYPVILILMNYDFGVKNYKYLNYMLWLYLIIYLFIFIADILLFYIVYEFMVGLVFYIMYLTANSRGGTEALLFFVGWAVIGSFLVGVAVIYIILTVHSTTFLNISNFYFTPDECYFLYFFFFLVLVQNYRFGRFDIDYLELMLKFQLVCLYF
jgi:NADH:ubiquinone oxidoreductase subunit 4 (subunit M)